MAMLADMIFPDPTIPLVHEDTGIGRLQLSMQIVADSCCAGSAATKLTISLPAESTPNSKEQSFGQRQDSSERRPKTLTKTWRRTIHFSPSIVL
jgi:hypothetical protein